MALRQKDPAIDDPGRAGAEVRIEDLLLLWDFLARSAGGLGTGEGDGALEGAFGAAPDLGGGVEAGRAGLDVKSLFAREADLEFVGAFAEAEVGVGFVGKVEGLRGGR